MLLNDFSWRSRSSNVISYPTASMDPSLNNELPYVTLADVKLPIKCHSRSMAMMHFDSSGKDEHFYGTVARFAKVPSSDSACLSVIMK